MTIKIVNDPKLAARRRLKSRVVSNCKLCTNVGFYRVGEDLYCLGHKQEAYTAMRRGVIVPNIHRHA